MLPKNPSKAEIQRLNYERYHYPCPMVQKRLHAINIKATTVMSNNLIGALTDLDRDFVGDWIQRYQQGCALNETRSLNRSFHAVNKMEVGLPLAMYRRANKPPHGAEWVTPMY
jgi:hypothetical protein